MNLPDWESAHDQVSGVGEGEDEGHYGEDDISRPRKNDRKYEYFPGQTEKNC